MCLRNRDNAVALLSRLRSLNAHSEGWPGPELGSAIPCLHPGCTWWSQWGQGLSLGVSVGGLQVSQAACYLHLAPAITLFAEVVRIKGSRETILGMSLPSSLLVWPSDL